MRPGKLTSIILRYEKVKLQRMLCGAKAMVSITLLITALTFSVCQAAPKKYTLKAVSAWPKPVYETQNFMKFLDFVKENVALRYPGELEIRYLGGPEVTKHTEQVESLRKGVFDMVFTTSAYYVSILPVMDGINMTEISTAAERAKGVNEFINKLHRERANVYFLGRMGTGMGFVLYLKKPVYKADLSGLKIRVSSSHIEFVKKLGGVPIAVPPPDIYTALERGVIDGFAWPQGLIKEWGWQEVIKYIIAKPTFYQAINQVLINLDTWNKLPNHLQELLVWTVEEAHQYALERGQKRLKNEWKEFRKKGIQFIDLPPAEAKKYRDAAYDTLWGVVIKRDPENGPKLKKLISRY
jgi:TRAP-type C4-dicarboxylate transport system substrate-binding protein